MPTDLFPHPRLPAATTARNPPAPFSLTCLSVPESHAPRNDLDQRPKPRQQHPQPEHRREEQRRQWTERGIPQQERTANHQHISRHVHHACSAVIAIARTPVPPDDAHLAKGASSPPPPPHPQATPRASRPGVPPSSTPYPAGCERHRKAGHNSTFRESSCP